MKKVKSRKTSERVDAYFKRRDQIKKRKKIFFLSLICLGAGMAFLFKAPIFAVNGFTITGNKMVKKEGVLNKDFINGKNIFLMDTNTVENEILKNPYIQTVEVSRVLPNQIAIKITERKMFYKIKLEEKVYILNNGLYIMDIVTDDKDLALVELKGIKANSIKVGERITNSDEVAEIALNVADNLIDKNKDSIFTLVDLTDTGDVSIYKDEIEIILGKPEKLDEKYKQAMSILNSKDINMKAGYIDISVPSQPVIKEKEVKEDEIKEKNKDTDKKTEKINEEKEQKDNKENNSQEDEEKKDLNETVNPTTSEELKPSEVEETTIQDEETKPVEPNNEKDNSGEINSYL